MAERPPSQIRGESIRVCHTAMLVPDHAPFGAWSGTSIAVWHTRIDSPRICEGGRSAILELCPLPCGRGKQPVYQFLGGVLEICGVIAYENVTGLAAQPLGN